MSRTIEQQFIDGGKSVLYRWVESVSIFEGTIIITYNKPVPRDLKVGAVMWRIDGGGWTICHPWDTMCIADPRGQDYFGPLELFRSLNKAILQMDEAKVSKIVFDTTAMAR